MSLLVPLPADSSQFLDRFAVSFSPRGTPFLELATVLDPVVCRDSPTSREIPDLSPSPSSPAKSLLEKEIDEAPGIFPKSRQNCL